MEYIIFNNTDGITATHLSFITKKDALLHIKKMREAFRVSQGYYRDNKGNKIMPEDIQYEIVKIKN
jgi:hypothetical protein